MMYILPLMVPTRIELFSSAEAPQMLPKLLSYLYLPESARNQCRWVRACTAMEWKFQFRGAQ